MSTELVPISPEGVEVANAYLTMGNIKGASEILGIGADKISQVLATREVKKYIDTIYLDTGYRNRNNIASLLDEMIASKVEEAQESQQYTSKDLADLISLAHKIRVDEAKLEIEREKQRDVTIKNQTNVQINDGGTFGAGNYGKLMDALMHEVS